MINPNNSGQTAVQHASSPVDPNLFGIDDDGPLPMQSYLNEEEEQGVVVPDTVIPLTESQLEEFVDQIDPLGECDDFGFDKYSQARQLLQSMLS